MMTKSDPAVAKVSSFLIIARGRKSQEEVSFAVTQRATKRGTGPATR